MILSSYKYNITVKELQRLLKRQRTVPVAGEELNA